MPVPRLTEDEYLRIERAATYKSEFVDGQIYAMAGGSARHSMLAVNACSELRAQLRGKGCRVMNSDMRLRTPDGAYHYADGSVVCGGTQLHPGSNDILVNPALLVEVLSPSTAGYDRGPKFEMYRLITTLRDYLVLRQDTIFAEHWTRNPDGSWTLRDYVGEDARIPLPNIECELHLGSIYDGVMDEPA